MVIAAPIEQILQRLVGNPGIELSAEVARFFLTLSLTPEDHARIALLSDKANEDDLTPEERDELAAYVLVGDFITLMQSRARAAIKRPSPAA